jgi:hypothetical protein
MRLLNLISGSMPKLTKSVVDAIPYPEAGQKFYRDSEIKGFGLRVGTGSKKYSRHGCSRHQPE